ncbi:MAG: NF038122 family metalloprotease [Armatimonadetes bacterium]|nr:NF038122 family metalloprotease [Armatimonadota bacterium]
MRSRSGTFRFALLSIGLSVSASAWAGFKIVPVYDPSITNDPQAAAIKACIESSIALYSAKFTDDVTVKIYFQKGGGLGTNIYGYYWNGAGVAYDVLDADAKSNDDIEATKHMRSTGFGSVGYTSANGRAMGLNTPGFLSAGGEGGFDGIVSLNTDICFFDHENPVGGKFDLYSATAHEIDEVLGTVSGTGDWLAFSADCFRYDGAGHHLFSGDTNTHAYFSVDATNMIVEYNQFGRTGGDWGDWVPHWPSMTQDWSIFSGIKIDPGEPEFRLLDVVGYDRSTQFPATYSIVRGVPQSGNLQSLFVVDGDRLTVKNGVVPVRNDFPVQVVVQGDSRFAVPGALRFLLTARTSVPTLSQTIELYDWTTGLYVPLDSRNGKVGDSTVTVSAPDAPRFVDPLTKHVRARIKYRVTQAALTSDWTVAINQAVWEITP